MATNLAIDNQLIEEARIIGNSPTKKAVVTEALIEYIQRRKQMAVLELLNTIEYDPAFNYKEQRNRL